MPGKAPNKGCGDYAAKHDEVTPEARTAADAIALAKAGPVDVLITDLGLPDMDGAQLAHALLALVPGLSIIFATGHSQPPEGAPPDALCIVKPYGTSELESALNKIASGSLSDA